MYVSSEIRLCHTYKHIYTPIYMRTYILYTYIHINTPVHMRGPRINIGVFICMHNTFVRVARLPYIYIYIYIYIYVYMYVCMYA